MCMRACVPIVSTCMVEFKKQKIDSVLGVIFLGF